MVENLCNKRSFSQENQTHHAGLTQAHLLARYGCHFCCCCCRMCLMLQYFTGKGQDSTRRTPLSPNCSLGCNHITHTSCGSFGPARDCQEATPLILDTQSAVVSPRSATEVQKSWNHGSPECSSKNIRASGSSITFVWCYFRSEVEIVGAVGFLVG